MFKNYIKKYFSSKVLLRLGMLVFTLFLTGCDDLNTGDGADANKDAQARCWQTAIIAATVKIIDQLFSGASGKVASGGGAVIMTGFSIWMALKFLKVLPSFKGESAGEVLTEVGHKLFLCSFCAWIVSSTGEITWAINTFVLPIYNAFLSLASSVINVDSTVSYNLGEVGEVTFTNSQTTCNASLASVSSIKGNILPMVNCVACSISTRLNAGISIGVDLLCNLSFSSIIVGLFMIVIFTAAKFGFVLFLVDSLFRLNFAVVLIPLMIMGIPFGFTRKWSSWCFLMFINSSGIMLFLGLLIALATRSLDIIMGNIGPKISAGTLENGDPVLLSMLMISLLVLNIPGLGVALADKFVEGGGSILFQKKISKFVIDTAKKAGAAIINAVTSGATSAITESLEKYETTREILDSAKQKANAINNKLNEIAGYNDDE